MVDSATKIQKWMQIDKKGELNSEMREFKKLLNAEQLENFYVDVLNYQSNLQNGGEEHSIRRLESIADFFKPMTDHELRGRLYSVKNEAKILLEEEKKESNSCVKKQ